MFHLYDGQHFFGMHLLWWVSWIAFIMIVFGIYEPVPRNPNRKRVAHQFGSTATNAWNMTTDGGITLVIGSNGEIGSRWCTGSPAHHIQRIHERQLTNRFYSAATAHCRPVMHAEGLVAAIEGHIPAVGRSSAIASVGMPIAPWPLRRLPRASPA